MRFLFDCVEQLDLAVHQLAHEEHPTYARFALILVDNAIELMLHRFCRDELSRDELFRRMKSPRLTEVDVADARSKFFDPKLAFCCRKGAIDDDQATIIRFAHALRNESYHAGVIREDVLRDIAIAYFHLACNLLQGWPRGHWFRDYSKTSAAVDKHFGPEPWQNDPRTGASTATTSLRALCPKPTRPLPTALSTSLSKQFATMEGGLRFVAEYLELSADAALEAIQFEMFIRGPKTPLTDADRVDPRTYLRRIDEIRATWSPTYRRSPLPGFAKRAGALKHEKSDSKAIAKYKQLLEDAAAVGEAIEEAAAYIDGNIQHDIDVARGK